MHFVQIMKKMQKMNGNKFLTSLLALPVAEDLEDQNVKDEERNDDAEVAPLVSCVPAKVDRIVFLTRLVWAVATSISRAGIDKIARSTISKEVGKVLATSLSDGSQHLDKIAFVADNRQAGHLVDSETFDKIVERVQPVHP